MINRKNEIDKIKSSISANQTKITTNELSSFIRGIKSLDNAAVDIDDGYSSINKNWGKRDSVIEAIYNNKYSEMRKISNFYFKTSGIYSRLCKYMAYMYRYDWMVTPYINENTSSDKDINNVLSDFHKILLYLDNSKLKKMFGDIALNVIKNGCYYGYLIDSQDKIVIQDLPVDYCRSRFFSEGRPVVEFNMKYFDDYFKDATQKVKILNIFPKDIKNGYIAYKNGKLPPQFKGDSAGWYMLDVKNSIKFNLNNEDYPIFMSVIPAIIDLDEAKGLDKRKMAQELLKIIIQKMPIDKNGDLVFDLDETRELHNSVVTMLKKAIGIDVLTTFADVEVADMNDNRSTAATDDLARVERGVYNEAGVSQMQFNTDGNLALEKSILNDAASLYNLLLQFENFINDIIDKYNKKPKKYYYRVQILTTTIYNYQDMSKLYKEQMLVGFSKMLPQIAMGQSQSAILANAYFENKILNLVEVFIPPMTSNTMSSDVLNRENTSDTGGRPEKDDDEKSEKTIMNEESKS